MRVSQRLDYTLRALVLLAMRPPGTYVAGAEIAAVLGLPQRVVEQQLSALVRAGVLRSRPGAGGGHTLALPASQITVAAVVRAVQGQVLDIPHVADSVASDVWADAERALEAHFASVTLETLAVRQRERHASAAESYVI